MSNSPFQNEIERIKKAREKAVLESLLIVEADAKLLCPVFTGTLKRSLTHAVKTEENITKGSIGSNVEYAYWAEKHQPYLEPAVDQNLENIKRKIAEVLAPEKE
ncbi:MAG: hypothetical protein JG776_2183 [Caloramator sp.]|jgi:hypothetical protein|uniref:hypothetical protein n=1 Tax=Caloramator sp. TaxID=1871330 RepID=UPI001DB14C10|nr:hypothetical protein [Caloramator sp.]MBZ4664465.1 hypothetical protein [Caloramator sp.]